MVNNLLDIISKIRIVPIQAINPEISSYKPVIRNYIIPSVNKNIRKQHNYSRKIINKLERTAKQDVFVNTQKTSASKKAVNITHKKQNINKNTGNKKGM